MRCTVEKKKEIHLHGCTPTSMIMQILTNTVYECIYGIYNETITLNISSSAPSAQVVKLCDKNNQQRP